MAARRGQPPKATEEDWSRAALAAIAASGLDGVSVEKLARVLGVTKGSFYGYFANRQDLVSAALDLWEHELATKIMEPLTAVGDPARRFELMAAATLLRRHPTGEGDVDAAVAAASEVELSLLGNRDVPEVREVLERVVATRVDFLADCLCGIGHDPQRARQFAINAYSLSLGTEALRRNAPGVAGEIDDSYLRTIIASYLRPEPPVADSSPTPEGH